MRTFNNILTIIFLLCVILGIVFKEGLFIIGAFACFGMYIIGDITYEANKE